MCIVDKIKQMKKIFSQRHLGNQYWDRHTTILSDQWLSQLIYRHKMTTMIG